MREHRLKLELLPGKTKEISLSGKYKRIYEFQEVMFDDEEINDSS